jgi:hypothetical protein
MADSPAMRTTFKGLYAFTQNNPQICFTWASLIYVQNKKSIQMNAYASIFEVRFIKNTQNPATKLQETAEEIIWNRSCKK